ncbi:MAG: hypothetical protein CFE26_17840 [Verrucomicrobiales bacterium VVV1]|nr:MAG: hypothetical protein CFE26_17840 [Verrucomicrobiales bacterium VVV1]
MKFRATLVRKCGKRVGAASGVPRSEHLAKFEIEHIFRRIELAVCVKPMAELPENRTDTTEQSGAFKAQILATADSLAGLIQDAMEEPALEWVRDRRSRWRRKRRGRRIDSPQGHRADRAEQARRIIADRWAFELQFLQAAVAEIREIALEFRLQLRIGIEAAKLLVNASVWIRQDAWQTLSS